MLKSNIFVIFGGHEWEHNISMRSGYDISKCLSENKVKVYNIYITKNFEWKYSNLEIDKMILNGKDIKKIQINENNCENVFQIGNGKINNIKVSCAILATHGKYGEDGKLQGLLEMYNIPYTGSKVLGSSIGMDKDICKKLVSSINIPVIESFTFNKGDYIDLDKISKVLGNSFIVKIVDGGSSRGVFKANTHNLNEKINEAFSLSNKILIEKEVNMREVEIGVIENNILHFSDLGEIKKNKNFYDYKQKYIENTELIIPAKVDDEIKKNIINYSIKIFKILNLKDYCRIDFFLVDNKIYFNEVNTLPGFQTESMFPKMWSKSKNFYNLIFNIIKKNI